MKNTFLFQSRPDRYNLEDKIIPGKKATWYATRYRKSMHPGDIILFWQSGKLSGIYGWGELIGTPYKNDGWEQYGVDVEYKEKFSQPIFAKDMKDHNALSDMLIFRAPSATNFLLELDEASAIKQIIADRQFLIPPIGDD